MKPPISCNSIISESLTDPFKPAALPLFCLLAFLPAIAHFARANVPTLNLLSAAGPVLASFWLARRTVSNWFQASLLAAAVSALLMTANLIITVEGCCQTLR